jgi:hypothetical protein
MTMACSMVTALAWTTPESIFHPVSAGTYSDNMTMVIRLMDGDAVLDNYEVAAFIDGECRGATWAHEDDGLYYLVIAGEGSGQPLEIRGAVDGEVMTLCTTLTYSSDGNVGTPWEPFVIDVNDTPRDINGDGVVNIADVVVLSNAIIAGLTDSKYDINNDGRVDANDVTALVDYIAD